MFLQFSLLAAICEVGLSQNNWLATTQFPWQNSQQSPYCYDGPSVFPWFPYRCPPFLAGRNEAQVKEYYYLINNKSDPMSKALQDVMIWGNSNGISNIVNDYLRNVTSYLQNISQRVKSQFGGSNVEETITRLLLNNDMSPKDRNTNISTYLNSAEPSIVAVVRAYNETGAGGPFGAYTNQYQTTGYPWYPGQWNPNPNNQQGPYNPYAQPCLVNFPGQGGPPPFVQNPQNGNWNNLNPDIGTGNNWNPFPGSMGK